MPLMKGERTAEARAVPPEPCTKAALTRSAHINTDLIQSLTALLALRSGWEKVKAINAKRPLKGDILMDSLSLGDSWKCISL